MSKQKKKGKNETQRTTSTEIEDFAKKSEKEFSLVYCLLGNCSAWFEDIGAWAVDNRSSRHMSRMRLVFLNVSEIDSDCYVDSGVDTMHVVNGVRCVRF